MKGSSLRLRRLALPMAVGALALSSCAVSEPAAVALLDPVAHAASIEQWRAERATNLIAEDGWTTLVGLYWLEPGGVAQVGSAPGSEVLLPDSAPANVGTITLTPNGDGSALAEFVPSPGVPLESVAMTPDSVDGYTVLRLGDVRFYLIERGGRYGIRVKDAASAARVNFSGLTWYPVDPTWHVNGRFIPSPHPVDFATEAGVTEHYESPGFVEFEQDGTTYKVEPVEEDGELFYVFRDATSGKTTYGASRFIYGPLPEKFEEGAPVVIDFNKAYNPPCVFTDYATCPLPRPQNRLTMAVEAGEKIYERNY